MKDAFGGILNIAFIAIFLMLVSGILGLVVNYTKAFKMKNIVISTIEQYEGASGCFSNEDSGCRGKMMSEAKNIGYNPSSLQCPTTKGYVKSNDLFCYKRIESDSGKNYVYSIITQVDINIPIINNIMGLSIFQVHGDTRAIKK